MITITAPASAAAGETICITVSGSSAPEVQVTFNGVPVEVDLDQSGRTLKITARAPSGGSGALEVVAKGSGRSTSATTFVD